MSSIAEGIVLLAALPMLAWVVHILVVLCVETGRDALEIFARWYSGQVEIARRGIEEDARRYGGRVIWYPINRQGD